MALPIGLNSAVSAAAGALGRRLDPYLAHNFLVEIDGLLCGGFSSVQGLESTIAVEERPEGGVNTHVRKVLREASFPNLVLSKGMTDLDTLWTWFDQTRQGVIQRKNLTLMLLDNSRWPAVWWDFTGAIPVKWSGPAFNAAQDSQVAIESLELAHLGMTKPLASAITSVGRGIRSQF
jgi:phage tail-like protein